MGLKIARVTEAKTAEEYALQAARAFDGKDFARAKTSLLSALELEPDNGRLFAQLGAVLLELGEWDRALLAGKRTVELTPYEADAYNLLGVTLFNLHWYQLAEQSFRRALEYDPDHKGANGNLVAAIREGKFEQKVPPAEFDSIKALLEVKPPTIALCMIVKNEEQFLDECLTSVAGAVDEICIVDTGSTDRTLDIARRHGAKIGFFEWTGDFATARNKSIELATSDWILILDADEHITEESKKELRRISREKHHIGHALLIENLLGNEAGDGSQMAMIFRFFQNRPDMRYAGLIHEQIATAAEKTGMTYGVSSVRIIHKGYLNQYLEQRDKHQRNLKILLEQERNEPDNPYCHFNLGQTYKLLNDNVEGERHYARSLELLKESNTAFNVPYYGSLYFSYTELLRDVGRFEEALAMAEEGIARFPGSSDLQFTRGNILLQMERYQEALKAFEGCRKFAGQVFAGGTDPGTSTYKATNAIGVCYSKLGKNALAKQYFKRALREWPKPNSEIHTNLGIIAASEEDWAAALKSLTAALEIDSGNFVAWLNLGSVCYRQGSFPESISAWRKALLLKPQSPDINFLMGDAWLKLRQLDAAILAFEAELEITPEHGSAALGLGIGHFLADRLADSLQAWQGYVERQPKSERVSEFRSAALFARVAHGMNVSAEDLRQTGLDPDVMASQWAQLLDLAVASLLFDRVEAVANQVTVITDFLPTFEETLGRLFLKWKVYDLAATFLLRQRERTPENPDLYFLLGETCLGLDKPEDALVMYQTCVGLDPQHAIGRVRLAKLEAQPA